MSGGVGPCSDIHLRPEGSHPPAISGKNPAKRRSFLTFRQLNALAVTVVFSISGLVSLEDFAFVTFSFIYMYFISKIAFPSLHPSMEQPPSPSNLFRLYTFIGALVGLFLPIAYIFEGIFEGDKEGIKACAPHVFLLASQFFMEGVALSDRFSIPIRVFVPVFYNSRRIFTIMEWVRTEMGKMEERYSGSRRRLHVGNALAMVNLVFWCFNLFGFLLPLHLPKAFKKYYSGYYKVKE